MAASPLKRALLKCGFGALPLIRIIQDLLKFNAWRRYTIRYTKFFHNLQLPEITDLKITVQKANAKNIVNNLNSYGHIRKNYVLLRS